jgi:hypothetical protein
LPIRARRYFRVERSQKTSLEWKKPTILDVRMRGKTNAFVGKKSVIVLEFVWTLCNVTYVYYYIGL